MGFDLYGLMPNDEPKPDRPDWDDRDQVKAYFAWQDNTPGAHFRANVWTWHPLFDFVYNHCGDIFIRYAIENTDFANIDKIYEECHHNNGFIIPKVLSKDIYERLDNLDQAGILDQSEIEDDIRRERLPLKQCNICEGKGTRNGWEGWKSKTEWLKFHTSLQEDSKSMGIQSTEEIISNLADIVNPTLKAQPVYTSYKWAHKMKGCNACHGTGEVKAAGANYTLEADMLREFAAFSNNSGGFEIC